tara:strand:- start:757 stop:2805 length:2049 start_codon:yes stop_codon:yes gene_type:complete
MAQTIQIKRGTGSSVPSSLAEGELAINLDSGKFYYGSGSSVLSDFRFDSITAERYIISSSVTHMTTSFSSGSTAFGDSADDTHQFTGSIDIAGNSFTMTHETTPTIRLKDTTNNFFVDLKQANNFGIELDGSSVQDFYIATNEYNGNTATTTALYMDGGNGLLSLNDQKVTINSDGDLYVDGNISGSSNSIIDAGSYRVDGATLANMNGGTLQLGTSAGVTQIDLGKSNAATPVFANGAITCSTDISSSGNIYANRFGNNLEINDIGTVATIAVDSAGSNSNSGLIFSVDGASKINIQKAGLPIRFHEDTLFDTSITASSNISASGTVTANTLRLASTTDASATSTGHAFQSGPTSGNNIIINGNEIMARNNGAVSNLHFNPDGSDITFNNSTSNKVVIGSGDVSASGDITAGNVASHGAIGFTQEGYSIAYYDNALSKIAIARNVNTPIEFGKGTCSTKLNGHFTASGDISSSANIYGDRYYSNDQLALNNVNGAITLGYDNTYPINIGKDTNPTRITGPLTASIISSSATVQADTGSFNAMTKLTQVIPWYYYNTSIHGYRKFIPHNSATDTTVSQPYNMILAPFDGQVRRVSIQSHAQNPGNLTCSIHIENSPVHNTSLTNIAEIKAISGAVQDTSYHFDFSASFSAGNAIYIGVQYDGGTTNTYINGSIAIDFNTTQG